MSVSFADLGVPASMVASLSARGIDAPFPIQAATIPEALAGRDICGRAPTGSGKTMAFGIPMILGIGQAKPRKPRGLVLVPTRELASQVCSELQLLAGHKGPSVEAFYGGVGFDRQIKAMRRGVEIIVCCPGRLADLINQRYVNLDDVDFVVIDEADRMADMGFLPEVKRLLDQCSEKRQTLLFSATLDGDVDVLIKRYQHNPSRHEYIADDEGGALAEHYFWKVDRLDRLKTAAVVIKKLGPTVVFCRTKRGADRIATQLEASGVKSAAIHGDRSQSQRERALHSFHLGRVQALVATDVAARGIHVDGVAGVIHYDPPADHKDYVHRSGRTARAGNRGVVVSLVAPELRKDVATIQRELGYPIGLDTFDLSLLDAGKAARPATHTADTSVAVVREAAPVREPSTSTGPAPKPRGTKARSSDRLRRDDRASRDARPAVEPENWDDEPVSSPAVATPRPAPKPVKIDRIADLSRTPLHDGQRRPSGAARRKAKRLAATEAALLGPVEDAADLRDGGSSRTSKGSGWVKSSNRGDVRGSNGSNGSGSKGRPSGGGSSSGRSSRPGSGSSGASSGRGRSTGGSGSSRGGSDSSSRSGGGARGPQAARSGSSRRPS